MSQIVALDKVSGVAVVISWGFLSVIDLYPPRSEAKTGAIGELPVVLRQLFMRARERLRTWRSLKERRAAWGPA